MSRHNSNRNSKKQPNQQVAGSNSGLPAYSWFNQQVLGLPGTASQQRAQLSKSTCDLTSGLSILVQAKGVRPAEQLR